MRMRIGRLSAVLLFICIGTMFSGCLSTLSQPKLKRIDGDIKCEFRVGKSAGTLNTVMPVDTDVVFDKDKFIELYTEGTQYNPFYLKNHTDTCDLRIAPGNPEIEKMLFNSTASFV